MKKIISMLLLCLLLLTACAPAAPEETEPLELDGEYTDAYAGTTLNVFNWALLISDGAEGTLDVNKEFEKLTGIKINYINYESNEAMYGKLKGGAVAYDIIVPSDYMIQRLISENMVQKLDFSKLTNYKNIDPEYRDLYYDPQNEYSVPYNVGMVGMIYNTSLVDEELDSWSAMWDEKYTDDILNFNNSRDAFAIAQFLLGIDVNTTDKDEWKKAADKLIEQGEIRQGLVMDEVFNKMEGGNAAIAPYYAGDFINMQENNEDLEFVYPKEGVNIFVDAVCVPSNAQNYDAAMMYINFLMEPAVALANAEYTCYATPNTAVRENDDYSFKDNKYLYPEEKVTCEYFHDLDPDIRAYYEKLWEAVVQA